MTGEGFSNEMKMLKHCLFSSSFNGTYYDQVYYFGGSFPDFYILFQSEIDGIRIAYFYHPFLSQIIIGNKVVFLFLR